MVIFFLIPFHFLLELEGRLNKRARGENNAGYGDIDFRILRVLAPGLPDRGVCSVARSSLSLRGNAEGLCRPFRFFFKPTSRQVCALDKLSGYIHLSVVELRRQKNFSLLRFGRSAGRLVHPGNELGSKLDQHSAK